MTTAWIKIYGGTQQPQFRLICFPYAGGGASIYGGWSKFLPDSFQICALQLPGREDRISEKPIDAMDDLIQAFHLSISSLLKQPFAFFGHSMGALIAYEYSLYLDDKHGIAPNHLFVSARRPPQIPNTRSPIHRQGKEEFLRSVKRLGGTPDELLNHEEMLALMIPLLRSDFALSENYQPNPVRHLRCPITVFGGDTDSEAPVGDLERWKEISIGSFRKQIYSGGHFFIHSMYEEMIRQIVTDLANHS